MKKLITRIFIIVAALLVVGVVLFQWLRFDTKRHSPAAITEFVSNGNNITVHYCRPYKKDRAIFGELVAYGEVWRTGANEATTFYTNKDLMIDGQPLPKGEYTLWTIPNETEWKIIFNDQMYGWGVGFDQQASRQAKFDVLTASVPVMQSESPTEQFTIDITPAENAAILSLAWDQTHVELPMHYTQ